MEPLLRIGTFGTHVIGNDRGYSFTGTVPYGVKQGGYSTEKDAISAFVSWYKNQDLKFQRENIANLRNDVFTLVLES